MSSKKLTDAMSDMVEGADRTAYGEHQQQASNIIIASLGDQALRIVRTIVGNPNTMMAKLDERYDSKSTASKIEKMSELVSMKYYNIKDDLSDHIDRMAGLLDQLKSMGNELADSLAIGILVASIEVHQLHAVTAAIKTLAEKDIKWEEITSRLLEERTAFLTEDGHRDRATPANSVRNGQGEEQSCSICGKPNHKTHQCYLNPLNPENKLGLPTGTTDKILAGEQRPNGTKKRRGKRGKGRSAVARAMPARDKRRVDRMMLDSGCTSHMTPKKDRVGKQEECAHTIHLADDSTVTAKEKGVRTVQWQTQDGLDDVHLSETLIVPNLAMSLLSVPALVRKNIGVAFLPGKAILIDLEDDYKILGQATQDKDGLFFIGDDQEKDNAKLLKADNRVTAMVSVAKKSYCGGAPQSDGQESLESNSESDKDKVEEPKTDKDKKKTDQPNQQKDLAKLWHLRLGHALPLRAVTRHVRDGLLPHVECASVDCESCAKGKFKRSFQGSLTSEDRIGALHVDTKGRIETESVNGHKYFLTIVEEHSRFLAVRPLRSKAEASAEVMKFTRYFERQTGRKVKRLHTDGGSEFKRAADDLQDMGVEVEYTTTYTPQSNGLAERAHGVILSLARTCLSQAKIPFRYWSYAVQHVVDCKNAVPHSTTKEVPQKVLFGHKSSDLVYTKPFGCLMHSQPTKPRLPTFAERVQDGLCLLHQGGGVYLVLIRGGVIRTKHVRVEERKFPGISLFSRARREKVSDTGSVTSTDDISQDAIDDSNWPDGGDDNKSVPGSADLDALTHVPPQPSTHGVTDDETESEIDEDDNDDNDGASREGYNLRTRQPVDYAESAMLSLYACMAQSDMIKPTD